MAVKQELPAKPAASTGPVFVPDAGALFQRDRSGESRSQEKTEGQVNFSTMAARAREAVDACTNSPPEAA